MDLRGTIQDISFSFIGEPLITFKLNRTAATNEILDYDKEQPLKLKISKAGNSRTLRQNNLMWKIINDIDNGLNGYQTESGRWDIYTTGIEELGVEYEDYKIPAKSVEIFKKSFRKCRVIEEYGEEVILRCFTGSSKFNKKQMGELIDWFIRYAAELQIPIIDYRNEWNDLYG